MEHSGRPSRGAGAASAVRSRAAVLCCAALLCLFPAHALAVFTSTPQAPSMQFSTATLAAPTSVAGETTCIPLTAVTVTVTWTATTSSFADGYEIARRAPGGNYVVIANPTGAATTSYVDTTTTFSTKYHYVVRATKLSWRSANSNQATVTTPGTLCT